MGHVVEGIVENHYLLCPDCGGRMDLETHACPICGAEPFAIYWQLAPDRTPELAMIMRTDNMGTHFARRRTREKFFGFARTYGGRSTWG